MTYQELEEEYNYELKNNRDLMCELSELKNRSCESCNGSFKSEGFTYCEKGSSPLSSCIFPIHPTFCCNRYERKDK